MSVELPILRGRPAGRPVITSVFLVVAILHSLLFIIVSPFLYVLDIIIALIGALSGESKEQIHKQLTLPHFWRRVVQSWIRVTS